jgi:phage-related minor tail protein
MTQRLAQAQERKSEAESAINETRGKVDQTKSAISSLTAKLATTGGNNSNKLNELEEKKANLEKQLQARRQEFEKFKTQMSSTNKPEGSSESITLPDLTPLKNEVEEAKRNKAAIEKELESAQK